MIAWKHPKSDQYKQNHAPCRSGLPNRPEITPAPRRQDTPKSRIIERHWTDGGGGSTSSFETGWLFGDNHDPRVDDQGFTITGLEVIVENLSVGLRQLGPGKAWMDYSYDWRVNIHGVLAILLPSTLTLSLSGISLLCVAALFRGRSLNKGTPRSA